MKKPRVITSEKIFIEKLVPGGQGIGTREDGKKGFFWNVLPGETVVKFTTVMEKSSYFEAIANETTNTSPHRINPPDECYLATSPWQIMSYDFELKQKEVLLAEVFRQNDITFDEQDFLLNNVQTDGKDLFYRNKMEYSLYWDITKEKIFLAFHQRGSHRKIPITHSSIEIPAIFKKAQSIVDDLNARNEEARKYQSLLLRTNQEGIISGGLLENGKSHPVFENLSDNILGKTYTYSPNGFFQINLPVYEMALKEIKRHITGAKVLDLYSGVGTIGLSVADNKELVLIESNKAAYSELKKNCDDRKQKINNSSITPVLSNAEEALDYIAPDQTVILDPPRAGCDRKLIDRLLEILPEKIIYLSCNPATQARDVAFLKSKYQINCMVPFNFFPRTPHLENLVVLEKKHK